MRTALRQKWKTSYIWLSADGWFLSNLEREYNFTRAEVDVRMPKLSNSAAAPTYLFPLFLLVSFHDMTIWKCHIVQYSVWGARWSVRFIIITATVTPHAYSPSKALLPLKLRIYVFCCCCRCCVCCCWLQFTIFHILPYALIGQKYKRLPQRCLISLADRQCVSALHSRKRNHAVDYFYDMFTQWKHTQSPGIQRLPAKQRGARPQIQQHAAEHM